MKKVKNNLKQHQSIVADILIDLLEHDETVRFTAQGPSMFPMIRSGARVSVKPLRQETRIPRGTIIFFRHHNRLILHRLIRHDPRTNICITTGDAALHGTQAVTLPDIIGIGCTVTHGTKKRRLDSLPARHLGLLLFYARPLRRLTDKIWFQHRRNL